MREEHPRRASSPVWEYGLQRGYEVGHHHVDALQVGAEEGGGMFMVMFGVISAAGVSNLQVTVCNAVQR